MERPSLDKVLEAILKLRSALSATEQQLSLGLYRLLALGQPVAPEALARAVRIDRAQVDAVLSDWPGVYRDAEGRVIGYWGLTIAKMRHQMLVDGRRLYAWCAWDTLFLPELLSSAAQVESSCPVSGARISLHVTPERVECQGARPVVSFVLPDPNEVAADVVSNFCHYVYFFVTAEAARGWSSAHPGTVIATLDEAWALGRERNARCYPGRKFSLGARESMPMR